MVGVFLWTLWKHTHNMAQRGGNQLHDLRVTMRRLQDAQNDLLQQLRLGQDLQKKAGVLVGEGRDSRRMYGGGMHGHIRYGRGQRGGASVTDQAAYAEAQVADAENRLYRREQSTDRTIKQGVGPTGIEALIAPDGLAPSGSMSGGQRGRGWYGRGQRGGASVTDQAAYAEAQVADAENRLYRREQSADRTIKQGVGPTGIEALIAPDGLAPMSGGRRQRGTSTNKPTKKPTKKSAKKSAKKSTKKPAAKKPAAKKSAKKSTKKPAAKKPAAKKTKSPAAKKKPAKKKKKTTAKKTTKKKETKK